MSNGAAAAPLLRLRDVVPAALIVVLLLGVAGCMGALGGGPLDVTPVASGTTGGSTAPAEADAPSFVVSDPEEPTAEWLRGFVDRLEESKRSESAPAAFRDRTALFSCGDFVLDQTMEVPPEAWDCLAGGVDDGAEVTIVRPTTEGDPIITYYRVGPEIDGMEYFTDPTLDKFGADTWEHMLCAVGTHPLDVVNCVRADAR